MSPLTPAEWAEYRAVRARVEAGHATQADAEFLLRAFRAALCTDPRCDVPDAPPPPPREAPFPGRLLL